MEPISFGYFHNVNHYLLAQCFLILVSGSLSK